MSVEQDFLVFAGEAGANVLTQTEYAALSALLTGFQSGIAPSAALNKAWRQGSVMASVLGQLIADITGQPVIDDGTIATIEENLATVFRGLGKLGIDTGAVNALVVTQAPAPSALYAGMDLTVIPANNGTGAATLDVNGLGALPIQYAAGSAIGSGAILAGIPIKVTLNAAKTAWIIGSNPTIPNATAPTQPVALAQSFGGATFHNVSSSRSIGTTYTNTSGRPMAVMVGVTTTGGTTLQGTVNSDTIYGPYVGASGFGIGMTFLVPPGGTYSLDSGNITLNNWYEIS